ncbi:hypothetical protein V8F66_14075 [Vreelandella sp. SM1641]|uniref:2-haloalkanoic acid dehalogenase n=1 Tax=Vreelandella sp. SM1641 TaxID=3126101 RepID=A0AAU7XHX3_9GAMM
MKAIVFDVFGTIVDWRSSLIHQFNELQKELGIELPSEVITDYLRNPLNMHTKSHFVLGIGTLTHYSGSYVATRSKGCSP